ncbi:DUF979 family protein [Proteiniborus sp. MB09-C3]|uniref:5-oxoproline transporter, DUF979 family subunit n=1 Tax=Proteiniborus sp. MB09-C3 TaxID=3050072 RepID=UPI002557518D|nr:DUF979 family protein [Proteiniborus sp. MB09-C3]WIV13805.1 DUF979 family protein [Proteiniborus sp. MB09-C3]
MIKLIGIIIVIIGFAFKFDLIGIPFVIKLGLNQNVIGILGLTSGFCGTLMTPMAANYNVVPVAVLEMKDRYGVIKKQIPVALIFQIIIMYIMGR